MPVFSLSDTLDKLAGTPLGQEASMYGPIRDLFIHLLGYPARDVDIDTAGEGGRPDVTVRVPSGRLDAQGRDTQKLPWIVVEAKDEHGVFRDPTRRENIFADKSKYISQDTAWFVMVEPTLWVLRPVTGGTMMDSARDIVIPLTLSNHEFEQHLAPLKADLAGLLPQLERFRAGDLTLIAVAKLSIPGWDTASHTTRTRILLNRQRFFQEIRDTTAHLQEIMRGTLERLAPTIATYQTLAQDFWSQFGKDGDGFDSHTLNLRGTPHGAVQIRQHDRAAARIKRQYLAKNPAIARLAIEGLPAFQHRTGASDDDLHALFAIETANLILARVLLLRFFEDHGFFGDLHYICNGGIEAFQHMRQYFKISYAQLLEQAYQEGSRLYAAAFDATELDWIFGLRDEILSNAIEWTLFRFARYDFTTIKGDILSGIYDRFMDRQQRKKFGEFYTPPSIARYIIERIGITQDSRVLDPACGSGTFLIESYRKMVGDDADRGAADYHDVVDVLQRIGGNDLNTFSAVLTQIQLLWQILSFKQDIEQEGFPDLVVTANVNSLVESDLWNTAERFAELDVQDYDAVVGNPPYIRAERSTQDLDRYSQEYFERGGISSQLNPYALFLYRALDRWCKPAADHTPAGKVGFVIPVSFFDSNKTARLRTLFAIGGRWTIREIVDLEVIYRDVFDADVYTAIIIAENRPAQPDDSVSIRIADPSCVQHKHAGAVPEFLLDALPESHIPYSVLFSPDGRILTRLTDKRLAVLEKLWTNPTFVDAAKPYWVQRKKGTIVAWTDRPSETDSGWEFRRMLTGGIAFRGHKAQISDGLDVYKGENVIATELQGSPLLPHCDVSHVDDPSLWRFADILPPQGYAVAQLAHCPNAVAFDPHRIAFTNLATIFFPCDEFTAVPFDLLLLSNIYVWFYALVARMGVVRALTSHVYPTNFGLLPWHDRLVDQAPILHAMRDVVISACRNAMTAEQSLFDHLNALNLPTLKQRVRQDKTARLTWSEFFQDADYTVTIEPRETTQTDEGLRLALSDNLFDWVTCSHPPIIQGLATALQQYDGHSFTKSALLNLPIPVTADEYDRWNAVVMQHQRDVLTKDMQQALDGLDRIVGHALGLTDDDITEIQRDLQEDAFLQRIRPRYPGTVTRKQGFRTGLDANTRYST